MRLKLNEFFDNRILIGAKNLLLEEMSEYIQENSSPFDPELIRFKNTSLKMKLTDHQIHVELDSIPDVLQEEYQVSNVIEFNKHASSLNLLDLNKPPKYYATQNETEKCECYLIAKLIEKAILLIFDVAKLAEFQFYSFSGNYLGSITRIRLNHDLVTGKFSIYDCLIFTDRYRIEKRDIAMLKDIMTIVDEEDYCVQNLPEIIENLKEFTKFPSIDAEVIISFEKSNRVKVPKRPIFYRIPFLVWTQQQKAFYVPDESILELVY